jgi:hypothetical protein
MKKTKNIFLTYSVAQNLFSFRVVLRLRGKIVPPPILAQLKNFLAKS